MEEENPIEPSDLMQYSIEQLEKLYESNKYSIQIIACLLKKYLTSNEETKLETLFLYAKSFFILPEECWIEYLDAKLRQSSNKEEYEQLLPLFEQGINHGFYYELSRKYTKFCTQLFKLGLMTLSQIKINFQKLIGKFNNDFNKGSKFYKKLRKFYLQQQQSTTDPKQKDLSNQIRQLFQRQLEHPLADIDLTWESYKEWEDSTNNNQNIEQMKKIYDKSYELIEKHLDIEEKFDECLGQNQLGVLIEFFNQLDPNGIGFRKIQNYYERVLDEYPYEIEIWRIYIEFIKSQLQIIPEQLIYYERAAKNCSSEIDFLKLYIRSQEKNSIDYAKIENDIMHFIGCMQEKQNQFILWQLLCELHYRVIVNKTIQIQAKNKNNLILSQITGVDLQLVIQMRDLFQRAIDFFQTYNKSEIEENSVYISNLLLFSANFEVYFTKDKAAMDKIITFGNINNARSVIKRAVNLVKDDIQEICLEYVEFERRFGGIEEIEKAEELMIQKVSAMISQEQQEEEDEKIIEEPKKEQKEKKQEEEKKEKKKEQKPEPEQEQSKRAIYHDTEQTVFLKNIPIHFTEEDIQNLFQNKEKVNECRLIKDKTTKESRGIAYIDFINSEEAQKACQQLNNKKIENCILNAYLSKPPSHDADLDARTLFLNDLPFTITEEILRKEFSLIEKNIEEIRIIKNKATGKPKGFAYMQLNSKEAAQLAIEKYSKLIIGNRKIIVLLSKSDKIVNNTILLKNLAFAVTETQIIDYFKEKGLEVIKALIVKNHEGRSRGNGFAEFRTYAQFMKALDFKQGELMGRTFEIIKSKSPITQKKQPERHTKGLSNEQSSEFIFDYGSQEKEKKLKKEDLRKKASQVIMSINQQQPHHDKIDIFEEESQEKIEKKVKTNNDFRNLLFGSK